MSDNPVYAAARQALSLGLCPVPILPSVGDNERDKKPAIMWGHLQKRLATDKEVDDWFKPRGANWVRGVAIIAGRVSGNFEVLDFDERTAFDKWAQSIKDHDLQEVVKNIPLVATPSGGRHLYYRVNGVVDGRLILARGTDKSILIETRGEGGYAIIPPTPAECHPDHRPYKFIRGSIDEIPTISADDRYALLSMARLCNEFVPSPIAPRNATIVTTRTTETGLRPGDDYNERGDVHALLRESGWQWIKEQGDETYWRRPGKTQGSHSATTRFSTRGFYCWSPSTDFDVEKPYNPFAVYTILKHGGDFSEAAKDLWKAGWGDHSAKFRVHKTLATTAATNGHKPELENSDLSLESLSEIVDEEEAERKKLETPPEDLELANEWVQIAKEKIAFVEGDQWYEYEGGRWKYSSLSIAKKMVQDWLEAKKAEMPKLKVTPARVKSVLFLAESKLGPHPTAEFDSRTGWIGMRNGVFDVDAGVLMPHRPEYFMTHQVPYDYDPDADCPLWRKFLSEVIIRKNGTQNTEWQSALQEWFGLALMPTPTIQAAHFWVGEGGNGKGVATRALENLVGTAYCCAIPVELLHDPYFRAQLFGRYVGFVNEPDRKAMQKNGPVFKQITGGDPISARNPTEKVFNFTFRGRIILSCNELPSTDDLSKGYFRRIILIEWRYNVPAEKRDSDLDAKLRAEMPGIFNWAIAGLRRVRETGKLTSSEESEELLSRYRKGEDVFARFFEDCCHIDAFAEVPVATVYRVYKRWCNANGERILSSHKMVEKLEKMGYDRSVKRFQAPGTLSWKSVKVWNGFAMPEEIDAPQED